MIIDVTPVRDGVGRARLLDMVEGRAKQVFKTWLEQQNTAFRDGIQVVAMDGFTGHAHNPSSPRDRDLWVCLESIK